MHKRDQSKNPENNANITTIKNKYIDKKIFKNVWFDIRTFKNIYYNRWLVQIISKFSAVIVRVLGQPLKYSLLKCTLHR